MKNEKKGIDNYSQKQNIWRGVHVIILQEKKINWRKQ